MSIKELIGKTIIDICGMEKGSSEINFTTSDGEKYKMYHYQDCCEYVRIVDVVGEVEDLIGVPVLDAYESSNAKPNDPEKYRDSEYVDSETWTFYSISTIKGSISLRWLGESNGYYSESVDFEKIN